MTAEEAPKKTDNSHIEEDDLEHEDSSKGEFPEPLNLDVKM